MCTCDKEIGTKFLAHQLGFGVRQSQERVAVTLGFVPGVCNECRGLVVEPHPVASTPGRTSKIKRYYWRELAFREFELFEQYGGKPDRYIYETGEVESEIVKNAREQALLDVKSLHKISPKYSYAEETSESFIDRLGIKIRNVRADYVQDGDRKAKVVHDGALVTVETYAEGIYNSLGYEVLFLESMPFHVIFSVFTWLVIQDSTDKNVEMCSFGERSAYEKDKSKNPIWVPLPSDFGTSAYAKRRSVQIEKHFKKITEGKEHLLWLFDYWLPYSEGLRQYLWAHRDEHISKARKVIEILDPLTTQKIVRYLLKAYWERYLGWPDLLVYNGHVYLFVEVKSSKDKLSEEQRHWIEGNQRELHLPFEVLKIHRTSAQHNHTADYHSASLRGNG